MADASQLAAWLRLQQAPGLGFMTAHRLLSALGSPEAVFQADRSLLQGLVGEKLTRTLLATPLPATLALIDKTIAWAEADGNHLLTLADEAYPELLLEIPDPPLLLYAKGRIALLNQPSLAIVGSRNASAQGAAHARQFAQALSAAGLTIVSGLALGIDTAAHEGALLDGGATVAVIGTGADIVYPSRNHALAHRIAERGCIVSEYALGTPALPANFPRRNRIISGLARGTLVVEAAAQSGSLITARLAAEQGRDVYAIPGSIQSPLARGCHDLIRQGARLVENAHDILCDFSGLQAQAPALQNQAECSASDHPDNDLLKIIGYDPVSLNVLAARAGLDTATMSARLLTLEIDGQVERLAGGMVRRSG
nr:DNA-processing protein DprA [uncultured Noviherbaspirillum sp.]